MGTTRLLWLVCLLLTILLSPALAQEVTPEQQVLIDEGKRIFSEETFGGRGVVCADCHHPHKHYRMEASDFAALPDEHVLFQGDEDNDLLKQYGLVKVFRDGLEQPFVMKQVPRIDDGRTTQTRIDEGILEFETFVDIGVASHMGPNARPATPDEKSALLAFLGSLRPESTVQLAENCTGAVPGEGLPGRPSFDTTNFLVTVPGDGTAVYTRTLFEPAGIQYSQADLVSLHTITEAVQQFALTGPPQSADPQASAIQVGETIHFTWSPTSRFGGGKGTETRTIPLEPDAVYVKITAIGTNCGSGGYEDRAAFNVVDPPFGVDHQGCCWNRIQAPVFTDLSVQEGIATVSFQEPRQTSHAPGELYTYTGTEVNLVPLGVGDVELGPVQTWRVIPSNVHGGGFVTAMLGGLTIPDGTLQWKYYGRSGSIVAEPSGQTAPKFFAMPAPPPPPTELELLWGNSTTAEQAALCAATFTNQCVGL